MQLRMSGKGYRQLLRWAAVPITDRKWAAPLSAAALGFGLFIGVAIGPGAAGTLATGALEVIEVPGFAAAPAAPDGEAPQAGAAGSSKSTAAEPAGQEPLFSGSSDGSGFESLPLSEPESGESAGSGTPSPADEKPAPEAESDSGEEALEGIVVHVNRAAGSYILAEPGGAMTAVHAPTAPRPGTRVEAPARLLANGTYAETGRRARSGTGSQAAVGGIVTYVDSTPAAPAYAVSRRGVSLLVHVRPDPGGAPPALPALGAFAKVVVEIDAREPPAETAVPEEPAATPGCAAEDGEAEPAPVPVPVSTRPPFVLWERHLDAAGAPLTYGDFAGIVVAICPESGQLLLSADDVREGAGVLRFEVPAGKFDLTRLTVGDSVLATATIGAEGTLSLTGLADDEHRRRADDRTTLQGDLAKS